MPKLSIIVTAYNAEKYIRRCIDSALSGGGDCEVIAVNDCSQDSTGQILREYEEKIHIVELEKNAGSVAITRNIGLENASGEYITYLDADDWYEPGAVRKILELLESDAPDILRFGYTLVYPDGRRRAPKGCIRGNELIKKEDFKEKIYPHFIGGIALNSVCLAVFRRSVVGKTRFLPQFKTAEDAAFCLEAYTGAQSVMLCEKPLYCYYQSKQGLTGGAISIAVKYKCNFMLSQKILTLLREWRMDTPMWRLRTIMRPVRLTLDKIGRG